MYLVLALILTDDLMADAIPISMTAEAKKSMAAVRKVLKHPSKQYLQHLCIYELELEKVYLEHLEDRESCTWVNKLVFAAFNQKGGGWHRQFFNEDFERAVLESH